MSKGNLIERMGADYCTQRMNGTLFNYKDKTYEFVEAHGENVACVMYSGTPEKPVSKSVNLPFSVFDNWKAIRWPVLGYRQAAAGQVLMQVGRRGSVQRGLHSGSLTTSFHPMTYAAANTFGLDLHYFQQGAALYLMTMQPSFTKFAEGMEQVLKGDIPGFAVSADFAVAPSEDVEFLEILFRNRRIGTVSETGAVKITAEGILPSWNNAINK